MILSEVRDYIRRRGQVSLQDLALHFNSPPDALRGMLERWERKGKIERVTPKAGCGSTCTQCNPGLVEWYVWHEAGSTISEQHLIRDLTCPDRK